MTKPGRTQGNLFKKEIPQMQEGYYSSGPNPNLAKFVEEHATPYDPTTDEYDVLPFDKPIKTTKTSAIYNMHPYWSKKPHDAIREYINHYIQPGDLILDPFTGSGGTNAVACQLNRPSIGIDISPASTFIASHLVKPYDIERIKEIFSKMMSELEDVRAWLYQTKCQKCEGRAEIQYTVWSQTYQCTKCLNVVSHHNFKKGKCPHCGEKISTSQKRFGYIPICTNIECLDGCSPKRFDRCIDDKSQINKNAFITWDQKKIEQIEKEEIPYWYPTNEFPKEWVSWRPNLEEAGNVSGFFTKRNLWAISSINDWIKDNKKIEGITWLTLALTASIMSISKKAQHLDGGGGYIPGNYVFPPEIKERNVFNTYNSIIRKMIKGVEEINEKSISTSVIFSTQSSMILDQITDNSIDYIFTDPPYSDKVPFGEFNFLWEVWLQNGLSWDKDEIIVNPKLGKNLTDWKGMLKSAIKEAFRVLKPNRWISVCYHDTSEGTWAHLQDIFAEVGFVSERLDTVLSIERSRKSWKQATTNQVQKRDLVINFRKPQKGEIHGEIAINGDEDQISFAQKAHLILTDSLERNPGNTADKLFDELVSRMVRKGEFERHNFDTLLRSIAEEVKTPDENGNTISRWYLLETAGEVDAAESRKEEAVASRLEDFMVEFLSDYPEFEGVHYSDLFEQYLPVGDKPRRMLVDWLPEFFYRTSEGTWRPPLDGDERQQKQHLRTNGTLRRIKRFLNAILNSVPPSERDRPENAATLANWINECRKAGLYDQGKLLYEQGGLSFDALSEKAQLEVKENYLICTRRTRKDDDKQISLL